MVMKKSVELAIIAWMMIAIFVMSLPAFAKDAEMPDKRQAAIQCPGIDFLEFIQKFSEDRQMQHDFTHDPLKKQYVNADAEPDPKMILQTMTKDQVIFPIMLSKNEQKKLSFELRIEEISSSHPKVILAKPDTDIVVMYFFYKTKSCWELIRVEDWSL
jgi:hypothetical protein